MGDAALERPGEITAREHSIDDPCREGVPAADAVIDLDPLPHG